MHKLNKKCVCGHTRKDHRTGCIGNIECKICDGCLIYHTKKTPDKEKEAFIEELRKAGVKVT